MFRTGDDLSFEEIRSNVAEQGSQILHDMAVAYVQGAFDDPHHSAMYCSLIACICEGKVEGSLDEEKQVVKWALTKEYHAELLRQEEEILNEVTGSGNVIQGPWKQ